MIKPFPPRAESAEALSRIASSDRQDEVVTLGPDDFQRIGLQPKETRLEVIRRAASRTAKSLARRQLDTPNETTERQLSRIALSTYRLLDPRQRIDRQSRAHVGRIRPGALYRAGRVEFSSDKILIQSCDSSARSVPTHHVGEFSADGKFVARVAENGATSSGPSSALGSADASMSESRAAGLALGYPKRKKRLRDRVSSPGMVLAVIIALLLTALVIWNWGQELRTLRERFAPTVSQQKEPQQSGSAAPIS